MTEERRRYSLWLQAVLLGAAVVAVYANSVRAPFLFDDDGAVLQNPTIRKLGSLEVLNPPNDGSTTTGRPIVNSTFALNYALSGTDVVSYHIFNLALHVLNALLLWALVRQTLALGDATAGARIAGIFSSKGRSPGGNAPASWIAFASALVWAVHPLQTETVVCVAQRTESLCAFFYLATLYGFARSATSADARTRWQIVSIATSTLGMAAKEVMVTAPLLVFLYDRTFVAGTFRRVLRERRGYYVALALTWLPLAWLVFRSGGARGASAGLGLGITPWSYLLQQADAIVRYLALSVWPHPLVLDYGTITPASVGDVAAQLLFVLALLGAALWASWRKPALGFCVAGFFLILAPSSSLVPLVTQTMAEHRMYLPLALIVVPAVMAFSTIGRRRYWTTIVFVAVALSGLTLQRNGDYRSVVSIWWDNVAKLPSNARAHNNLAHALRERGERQTAESHFLRAIALQPSYVSALYNYGVALLEWNRPADAIPRFEQAIAIAPNHWDARVNLGIALVRSRRAAEALPHFETALKARETADVHYNLAVALLDLDQRAAAKVHLEHTLRLEPRWTEAHFRLGRVAERDGDLPAAVRRYREVLSLEPSHGDAHQRLGLIAARAGDLENAAVHFRAAIAASPNDADAYANLANVQLLLSQPDAAVANYERALRLRPDDPRLRASLDLARQSQR